MLLASFVRDRKAELRADFQQFYGLNIDAMGRGYTIRHAADLAAMLPSASRTFVSIDPENAWTLQDRILARIESWCHVSAWMQTKDGMKNRNRPVPLIEAKNGGRRRSDAVSLDISDYERILSKPRKEVGNGD